MSEGRPSFIASVTTAKAHADRWMRLVSRSEGEALVHRPGFTVLNRGTSASALKQVTSMPSRRMVAVARKAREIVLGRDERVELERIVRASTSEQRLVARARLVLLAAAGETDAVIAPRVGLSAHKASKWRTRCAEERPAR